MFIHQSCFVPIKIRDVPDPHFYRIQDFTGSLIRNRIRIPDLAFD